MRVLTVLGHDLKVKVSPTWLDKAACPAALKFQYIDKHPRDFSVPAERGSAAHAAIADLTSLCLTREIQPSDLEDAALKGAVDTHTDHRLFDEIPEIYRWVKLWRDRYTISKHLVGQEEKLAIDGDFEECPWDEADFRGIVDVIDIKGTHCVVTDYKSQPYVMSQTDLDAHKQMTFYAWLVSKFYPFVKTFEVRIWYLRFGFYHKTPRTKEQIEDFQEGLMMQVDKVMSIDNWEPIPGSHCTWCDHSGRCPVGKPDEDGSYRPLPLAIVTEDQAKHYASELRVIEQRREKISSALRGYVKGREEPVRITPTFAYGYKSSPTVFFPPSEVLKVLKKHGVDIPTYATFSATSIKKLMKSSEQHQPALFHDLESISKNTTRTQFSGFELK